MKHRGQQSVSCGAVQKTCFNLCESRPRWPCSIAGLAVAVFIGLLNVYSPVFSFNVVPATKCATEDGRLRLRHAEWRASSPRALSLSVLNRLNKVFLSVSGERHCPE